MTDWRGDPELLVGLESSGESVGVKMVAFRGEVREEVESTERCCWSEKRREKRGERSWYCGRETAMGASVGERRDIRTVGGVVLWIREEEGGGGGGVREMGRERLELMA